MNKKQNTDPPDYAFPSNRETRVSASEFDFEKHIPYCLARTSNVVQAATTPGYLANLEDIAPLSMREFRVLIVVAKFGPISPAKAAERTGIDRATVTRAIGGLKDLALIETAKNQKDRRGKYVALTETGAEVCNRAFPMMKQRDAEITSVLTPEETAAFRHILNKIFNRAITLLEE